MLGLVGWLWVWVLLDERINLAGGSDALTEVGRLADGPDLNDLGLTPFQVIEDQLDICHGGGER